MILSHQTNRENVLSLWRTLAFRAVWSSSAAAAACRCCSTPASSLVATMSSHTMSLQLFDRALMMCAVVLRLCACCIACCLRISAVCRRAAAAYADACEWIFGCSHLHFLAKKAALLPELAADMARFCVRHFGAFGLAGLPHHSCTLQTPLFGLSGPLAPPFYSHLRRYPRRATQTHGQVRKAE